MIVFVCRAHTIRLKFRLKICLRLRLPELQEQ